MEPSTPGPDIEVAVDAIWFISIIESEISEGVIIAVQLISRREVFEVIEGAEQKHPELNVGITVKVFSIPFLFSVKFLPETSDASWSFKGKSSWFDSVVILLILDILVIALANHRE